MRTLLIKGWILGPIAAIIGLFYCAAFESSTLDNNRRIWRHDSLVRVYELAAQRDFKKLKDSGILDPLSYDYMVDQDDLFGPIEEWSIDSETHCWVKRPGLTSVDALDGAYSRSYDWGDDDHLYIGPAEVETDPYDETKAKTSDEALAAARAFIHQRADGESKVIGKLEITKKRRHWLVTENVQSRKGRERWYVIVPFSGPISRVVDLAAPGDTK